MITLAIKESISRKVCSYTSDGEASHGVTRVEPMSLLAIDMSYCVSGDPVEGVGQFAILTELQFTNSEHDVALYARDVGYEFDDKLSIFDNVKRYVKHRLPLYPVPFNIDGKLYIGFYTHVVGESYSRCRDGDERARIRTGNEKLFAEINEQHVHHYVNRFLNGAIKDRMGGWNRDTEWKIGRFHSGDDERALINKEFEASLSAIEAEKPMADKVLREKELLAQLEQAASELVTIREEKASLTEAHFKTKGLIGDVAIANLSKHNKELVERRVEFLLEKTKDTPVIK